MPNYACCLPSNLKGAQMMTAVNCGIHLPIWIGNCYFVHDNMKYPEDEERWILSLTLSGSLIACIASGILCFGLRSIHAKIVLGSLIADVIGALLFTIGLIAISYLCWPVPVWLAVVVYLALQGWIMLLVHGANQEVKNANTWANTAAPSASKC